MPSKSRRSSPPSQEPTGALPSTEAELVLVTRTESAFRASAGRFEALSGESTRTLEELLKDHGAVLAPLFGATEERVLAATQALSTQAAPDAPLHDLSTFYRVQAPQGDLTKLQADLLAQDLVDGAYVKPGAEPATGINDAQPLAEEAPSVTPDFSARQGYLDAAPGGVNARWAWTQAGGKGSGIRIIDIEGAWRFTHEDLTGNQGGVVAGTSSADIQWRDHGTAVIGEFSGDHNPFGIQGISPDAVVSAVSIFGGLGSAAAINAAASRLRAGDVLLIELHRPGPRFAFAQRRDQRGYIAVEWWPDDFLAIRNAVNRGIIVVEAAGNGAENLDDALYQTAAAGFPAGWTNPFRRSNRDSGAIVVGAGAPPVGTHGRNHGPDRSRLDFSNFGALIDAQGWGREVTTTGYGDLQGGSNEDLWYTDTFSGTSSASPIVVGVAAALQGMARARGHALVTPPQFRNLLRTTGSPQQDAPGRPVAQRIGNRPDLRALHAALFGAKSLLKESVKEGKEAFKELKDVRKETKEVAKDLKDSRKEIKEAAKELKDSRKELKEVAKDLKDQRKEGKEIKEGRKEIKEFAQDKRPLEKQLVREKPKDIRENIDLGQGLTPQTADEFVPAAQEERLQALEAAVDLLTHFIGADLRPDLLGAGLQQDAQSLADQEAEAKSQKDLKDNESF
jgi:subtilisin family serine protease